MASLAKDIADAVVTVLGSVSGAPATIQVRKEGTVGPRITKPIVVVNVEDERVVGRAFGGVILKEYKVVVSIFRINAGNIASDLDLSPLAGVSAVYDVDLADNPEWEHQKFSEGAEVSRFGLLYHTSEPRNG